MEHYNKLLQTEELYSQSVEMIKASIIGIQDQIHPIKKFLGDRKKEIVKQISQKRCSYVLDILECTESFYEYTLNELINIERACEECLIRFHIDLLTATKSRMQPPSYLSPEEMRRAYEMCCDAFDEIKDEPSCRCTWENIPQWWLDHTQDVIGKPRGSIRTEFDETDLKFKQEIIYLRTKMFSLPRKRIGLKSGNEIISGPGRHRSSIRLAMKTAEFLENIKEEEMTTTLSVQHELSKINSLKFIDGVFTSCDIWFKILDFYGHQYGSKWHLSLCPQIENIARKRLIPALHLDPCVTFDFLSTINQFTKFSLTRKDLTSLLKDDNERAWVNSWKMQIHMIGGKEIAATLIQAYWRGYWLRRRKAQSCRLYIAASLVWYAWLTLKGKRKMHRRYLDKMLISMQTTRQLMVKLSKDFRSVIQEPHVVVHLPSIGHHMEIRCALNPKMFAIYQNITILRICFVRNPKTDVVYILPVKPTHDLLTMYSDFIESISPEENVAKRITFIALSQAETFKNRALNVSRILHCSEDSLREIKKKIAGKPAYFLPCVIDECDMKVAGNLEVPLLSTELDLQKQFLNSSTMSEMIDNFGLLQPPHTRNITDYDILCTSLAELMILHTEVCVWLIKLNYSVANKHCGIFLINHISVPFMPVLRREREKYGELWIHDPSLREEFHERLKEHLPRVVCNVTRLSKIYNSWKEFYAHVQKFGCLLQAVPVAKSSKTIVVCLLVPGKATKEPPRWLGTADKINLESRFSTSIYLLPQSSLDIAKIEPTVNKFATCMQESGYFGYLCVECFCYVDKAEEKLIVLLLNVFPYYSYSQGYIDWMKFAIGGFYNHPKNQFLSDVVVTVSEYERRKSSFIFMEKTHEWNETAERYAVAISQLHHTGFSSYRWRNLRRLFEKSGIVFEREKRQGSSIILHDGEIRNFGLMVAVSSSMTTTLSMVHDNLEKLHENLTIKSKEKPETNLPALVDFFLKLSLDYQNLVTDVCSPNF
ncbi:IQ motif-containing protein H [Anthophora plagiata]